MSAGRGAADSGATEWTATSAGPSPEETASQVRVRMAATPVSVTVVRRMVDEALQSWGQDGLVDDVALCVTELSTNSTLHGASNFEVEVRLHPDGIELCVLDDGSTPAGLIASRVEHQPVDEVTIDAAGTTGRGLFIVSMLASVWGIEDTASGVRIWAFFRPDPAVAASPARAPQVLAGHSPPTADAGSYARVHLDGCPADLLVAHDENLADLVRELQVMAIGPLEPVLRTVLEEIVGVVQRNAVTWDAAKAMARQAVRAGEPVVDITVLAPWRVREEVATLRRAVGRAEALSAQGRLMTMPAPPPVQTLRDWMEEQFLQQVEHRAPAVPFHEWHAGRPGSA